MTENDTIVVPVITAMTVVQMLRDLARQTAKRGDVWEFSAVHVGRVAGELEELIVEKQR